MVPELDQWRQRAEAVAKNGHVAQIVELHAVLTGPNKFCDRRFAVALLVELVEKGVADIVPGQLILLERRRPGKAAFCEPAGKPGSGANETVPAPMPWRITPSNVNVPASRRSRNCTGPPAPESCEDVSASSCAIGMSNPDDELPSTSRK